MQPTQTWQSYFPPSITERYAVSETRSAAAIMEVTTPDAFTDMVDVLSNFKITFDDLVRPGGNQSAIAKGLDEAFRVKNWRETKYVQRLETTLIISPWRKAGEKGVTREKYPPLEFGGHKVDNVKGRAALDIEWNAKDGALDRDFGNYVALHDAGVIDVGVIVCRAASLRALAIDLIQQAKAVKVPDEFTKWNERMSKLADDPYGTTTTANFERLNNRIARGDGRGCPMLGIGIESSVYSPPKTSVEEEVLRLAEALQNT